MRFAIVVAVILLPATAVANSVGQPPSNETAVESTASASGQADNTNSASLEPTATEEPTRSPSPTRAATPAPTRVPTPVPTPVLGREPTGPTQTATVVQIVDGDTIRVDIGGVVYPVRYIGIDTPEARPTAEWMSVEATAANRSLVMGKEVVLETDVSNTDRYDRLLRYVWLEQGDGWLLVNLELLRRGVAQVTTYPPDVKYVDLLYLQAQEVARSAGTGLWGTPPTPVSTVAPPAPPAPPAPTAAPANCHPSYVGACLAIGKGDYDCAGGSGNGPNYTGPVRVVGPDEFELDRDGDGWGCE